MRPPVKAKLPGVLQKIFGGLTQEGIAMPNGDFENAQQAQNTIPEVHLDSIDSTPPQSPIQKPSFVQANQSQPIPGLDTLGNKALTTKGKVLSVILQAAAGGLQGSQYANAGQSFTDVSRLPFIQALNRQQVVKGQLENQFSKMQLSQMNMPVKLADGSTIPLWQAMQQQKYDEVQSSINKNRAETAAIPAKTALEKAQTEAANYKDDPNQGLIDLRTKQPVNPAGLAPLSAEEAAVLGKQEGDRVPLKLKNTANEIVNRGIRPVQANGRSLLVNGQGNTIKDLGKATPLVTMQAQLGAAGNPQSPEFQSVVDAVGQGKMDLQTAAGRMGRFPGASFALMSAIEQKYPNYFQGNYDAAKRVLDSFTSGSYSQNLNAIATAREHMKTFGQLAKELDNGRVRAFNSLGNALGVQFGDDAATNFNIAKHFFSGEVGKAVVAGGGTAGERDQLANSIETSSSWKQLSGALKTADALLNGKQKTLRDTFSSGMNAAPNFGNGTSAPQGNRPPLSSFEH